MNAKRDVLSFETKCTKVKIDYSRCEAVRSKSENPACGFACIKADRMYDRSILRIEGKRPVLAVPAEEVKKVSNESLSWEFACNQTGNRAIEIIIPFPGLEEYRKTANLSERR
jgi:hypothetical protein